MNEGRASVEAFDEANVRGERCALAMIVSVEGSSYRRPGARMLVCEGGLSTGTISAGCLESDVIEHAKRVIRTAKAVLVEYDTASTSDEMAWGLGLGCNGTVRVLVEPLTPDSPYVEALRRSCEANAAPVLVATVYQHTPSESAPGSARIETGTRLFLDEEWDVRSDKLSDRVAAMLESELVCDQPHVNADGISGRVAAYRVTGSPAIASASEVSACRPSRSAPTGENENLGAAGVALTPADLRE